MALDFRGVDAGIEARARNEIQASISLLSANIASLSQLVRKFKVHFIHF